MAKSKEFEWSLTLLVLIFLSTLVIFAGIIVISAIILRISTILRLREAKKKFFANTKIIGFFHPNCDAGAGGEKVLWSAVQALQLKQESGSERVQILIYSASQMDEAAILD